MWMASVNKMSFSPSMFTLVALVATTIAPMKVTLSLEWYTDWL